MKKKPSLPTRPSAPIWMVTYGDMMTLLLAVFVMIVAYSSIEETKFLGALESFKGALGILKSHESVQNKPYMSFEGLMDQEEMVNRIRRIQEVIEAKNLQDAVRVDVNDSGMNIRLGDQVLFDPGQADLKDESYALLFSIAETIREVTKKVYVEGHTDNVPINTPRFPSNWELSSARALNVVKFFYQKGGIPAEYLAAVGHGEFRPLNRNNSPENRARNRRVEIFITWN